MNLVPTQNGHFELESGFHASVWMDLETLFLDVARMEPVAADLASRVVRYQPEIICGPLVEGAFLGLFVARDLRIPFTYTERSAAYVYNLPPVLRHRVRGKRVAIINDVISAGSAVGGTAHSLDDAGAHIVAIGALLVLGDWTRRFGAERNIAVEALEESKYEMWKPGECPLCRGGVPLERKAEGRRQKAEGRRQKVESRRLKAER